MSHKQNTPRAIEVGFPIAEINRLAVPERNSFKPIYQMHKWFARRASCVFRAILLGALKPAFQPDGTPTDLMAEFYKDHTNDPDTKGKHILDPFMGGGTTVVEALRLGCRVTGIDLNPVAWFIVKTEIEPVDVPALQEAFERLADRPVAWNNGKPLRETLLNLYKTDVLEGLEADVIYTFWVKHAVCTDINCRREVPLFKDYIISRKPPSVRYFKDVACPHCGQLYDWDVENVSLIMAPSLMVDAPRGSSGIGRPKAKWSYEPLENNKKPLPKVTCPHCQKKGVPQLKGRKSVRKKVPYTALLCPACEAVWQWRGELPEGEVTCPGCKHAYDPYKGNVPQKGKFVCPSCGNKDKIIESIRTLPRDQRLPIRPYAQHAYLSREIFAEETAGPTQDDLFARRAETKTKGNGQPKAVDSAGAAEVLRWLPKSGKFFKGFTPSDRARLQKADALWEKHKDRLPFPKSKIPLGEKTKSGLLAHHYNHWHEMFLPRQLLGLATLLDGITEERNETLKEMLLCAFSNTLEGNNQFVRNITGRTTPGGTPPAGIFARHDYQPKATLCEQNVWGTVSGNNTFISRFEALSKGILFRVNWPGVSEGEVLDPLSEKIQSELLSQSVTDISGGTSQFVITDPPYVGNVNYAELSDFFYVWLRLALKERYPYFAPEYTPKAEEIIENRTRGKKTSDFYDGLAQAFTRIRETLPDDGLLVFTFHHTDQEGTIWEGLLRTLCDTGFEIAAIYPIHAEREQSLHLMDKENVSYDLIHVCHKRRSVPEKRSWAGIRQEVRRRARAELKAIEEGRYGKESLLLADVRLICIGKCLQLYSTHYGGVLDHKGNPLSLHHALQDIGTMVDQLVTREKPLPSELEDVDPISYAWFRVLMKVRREVKVDEVNKALRAMQVSAEDLKKAGLLIRGRTGRGRTYEVKQPVDRINVLLEKLKAPETPGGIQGSLFDDVGDPLVRELRLVDLIHLLIGLSEGGQSVGPWLERFSGYRPRVRAALRFIREARPDWQGPISRILPLVDELALFSHTASENSPPPAGGARGGG